MTPRTIRTRTSARLAAAGAAVGLVATVAACATGVPAGPDLPLATADTARHVVTVVDADATPGVVDATERLGLTMLGAAPREGNVVVSPASAVVALSMLAEGARGETATSLDAALGATGAERTDAVNALLAALEAYDGDPAAVQDTELPKRPLAHVANQVVLDDQAQVHDEYLESLATGYGAGVLHTDLGTASGIAPLSDWVRFHTGGLIEQSAIEPDRELRLVLQNAVLFAARWEAPFDEGETAPSRFAIGADGEVDVESLHLTHEWAHARDASGWSAVRLPYVEGFHADVVLPPTGTDPAELTPGRLAALREELDAAPPQEIALTMPTLDIPVEEPMDLKPALGAAGLGGLFDPASPPDLSGISDEDLYVSQAWQQALLQVDAEGTVAAAVTELGMQATSSNAPAVPMEFRVDRPYVFSVSHTDTGWPLFAAAVRDPRH